MKKTRKSRNQSVSYALVTFAYLYAGTVLRKPFYASGVPILGFLVCSAAVLAFSYLFARYFAGHNDRGTRAPSGILAASVCVCAVIFGASMIVRFLLSLSYFSADYGTPFVVICAGAGCIGCALFCASRGRLNVSGFAFLTAIPFAIWTFAGFFAFFETKRAFPIHAPLEGLTASGLVPLLAETAYICLDIVFLAVVLCDKESDETRKIAPRAFFHGAVMFVLASGATLFKNLLLFGERLASAAANPDLAAIRLMPLFDLPEISVFMGTFAVTVKISVYLACCMYLLKNAFGTKYRHTAVCGTFAVALGLAGTAFYFLRQNGAWSGLDYAVLFLFCIAALFCFPVYAVRQLPQNAGRP